MNTELMFSSASAEWATPQDLFDQLHNEFRFTLDAAASSANFKCSDYYALDHPVPHMRDGLAGVWDGRVWCNPPYGRGIGQWVEKGWLAALDGADVVVLLLPARTDTRWFHDFCVKGEVRFIRGRVKFGGNANAAPFPSMVVIFRPPSWAEGPYYWRTMRG
jgi:phage N-6-adenine-methyltransferase